MMALIALAAVDRVRDDRRRRALSRRVRAAAAADPATRADAVDTLRAEALVVGARPRGLRAASETRLAVAWLMLVDDRADAALDVLGLLDPNRLTRAQQLELAAHALEAHLLLGQAQAAERVLDGYAVGMRGSVGRALAGHARARIALLRGDARGALRYLDEIAPLSEFIAAAVGITRARALALAKRPADEVWAQLVAIDHDARARLARRHADEPAGVLARRLLDGLGPPVAS
jgi:hypothetical protein